MMVSTRDHTSDLADEVVGAVAITRPSVVQPAGPLVALGEGQLDDAQLNTFLASSGNQHVGDTGERINFMQSGRRGCELPYDVKVK